MNIKLFSNQHLTSPEPLRSGSIHIWILSGTDGHTALQELLCHYLDCSTEALVFQKGVHGKPSLDFEKMNLGQKIYFNLSHSGDHAALAFSRDSDIGIDIEKIHPLKKIQLIERFFHPEEVRFFHALNDEDCEQLFFHFWTMKEAFVKGLGTGLSLPIDSFCIEPLTPPETASFFRKETRLYHITKSQEDYTGWRIQTVPVPDLYQCSIAYQLTDS